MPNGSWSRVTSKNRRKAVFKEVKVVPGPIDFQISSEGQESIPTRTCRQKEKRSPFGSKILSTACFLFSRELYHNFTDHTFAFHYIAGESKTSLRLLWFNVLANQTNETSNRNELASGSWHWPQLSIQLVTFNDQRKKTERRLHWTEIQLSWIPLWSPIEVCTAIRLATSNLRNLWMKLRWLWSELA